MAYKIFQMEPFVGEEELVYLEEVIKNKWVTEGPFSERFLERVKSFTGAKYATLANNGTLALFISLLALGIGEGDEVIIPNFSFIASATSVVFTGAKPVFVDVKGTNGLINTDLLEKYVTPKTKAIMPVHIYGQGADMEKICDFAYKHGLKIIEDAAQGYGVFYKGNHVGTIGDVGIISFFADKTITTGEGAVILTNDVEIYDKLRYLRNQGRMNSGSFTHPFLGMNFRMTDLQCAIGLAQTEKFKKIEGIKLKNYNQYRKLLGELPTISFLEEEKYGNIVPFRVNILIDKALDLINHLESFSIQTRGFFYPLHKQPCFKYLNCNDSDYYNSNSLNEKGICLPVHCGLNEEDITFICNKIAAFMK